MKKNFTRLAFFCLLLTSALLNAQPTPELLWYKFDGSGTSVPNYASTPPVGTTTATIMGSITQGNTGQCGGALTGSGNSASTDYLNTGYATSLSGSWTISFYTKDITPSSTLFYIFGDNTASSFRCFTNGVALANNWILRGPITDVTIPGGATVAPHVNTFVYDATAGYIYGYLDGVLVTSVAQAPFSVSGTGPFKVMGYSTNVGAPAGGKLDEFRMYNRALTAAEVAQLTYVHTTSTIAPVSCGSYTSPSGMTLASSGTYMDTIPNSTGCDSVITINLTVNSPSTSTLSATACSSYTSPSGNTLTSSGTYTDTIPNAMGCDSIITINLTVRQPSASTITAFACSSYTSPSGMTLTSTGTYMDTISNAVGCDSVITINLTVGMPSYNSFSVTTCDMYTAPSGAMYMTSGTYNDTITNAAGCDSIMTITVTINNSSSSTISPVACDSYTSPANNLYTTSGTYTEVIPNATGCDSTITINLTVLISSSSTITVSSCGPYISPGGNTYTLSGSYVDVIPNAAGCDSTIFIALTVNTVNVNVTQNNATLTAAATGATYQWIDCNGNTPINGATSQSYTATANGSYAVVVTENSCTDTSICMNVTGIGINENALAETISVYPNPSTGNFNIDLGKAYQHATVIITDVTGRVVYAEALNNQQLLPVALNAPAGAYVVTVTAGDDRAVIRLIKE